MSNLMDTIQNENESCERIYSLVSQEIALYEQLIDTARQKQTAILSNDRTLLQELTATEQMQANRALNMIETRQLLLREIFKNLELEVETTLSNLLQFTGKSIDPDWIRAYRRLTEKVKELTRLNFENQQLLRTSLFYLREVVSVLFPGDKNRLNVYDKNGSMNGRKQESKVLNYQV